MYDPILRGILHDLSPFFGPNSSPSQIRLLNHVTTFGRAVGSRSFIKTNSMRKADEPHTFGFPSVNPDMTLATRGVGASASRN